MMAVYVTGKKKKQMSVLQTTRFPEGKRLIQAGKVYEKLKKKTEKSGKKKKKTNLGCHCG